MQHEIPESKLCPRCDTVKASSEFYVNTSRVDGLTYYCKVCVLEYSKEPRKGSRRNVAATQKDCSNCNRTLPAAAFTYSQHSEDKLRPDCRSCRMSRKKNPSLETILEMEETMAIIYKDGQAQIGDVEEHRAEFEQYVYQQMLIRGLLKDWKPPIWIHSSSIPV